VAAVIPFGFPIAEPERQTPEKLDERLHIDGWSNAVR